MRMSDVFKRILVTILRVKPKILSAEEKEKMKRKLTEVNRTHDRDLTTCDKELIEGLKMEEVKLSNCSGWFISRERNPEDKIVYYIHGGGFVNSYTRDRMRFVSYLVKKFGYNVFSIDYRLAPEFMFPCAPNDCLEGYQVLLEKIDSNKIAVIGESAGGTLSFVLSLVSKDKGLPQPAAIYANSPATQLIEYTDSYRKYSLKRDFIVTEGIIENMMGIYFNSEDGKNPYVSPLYGQLSGLPPVTITASNCECLLDDSVMMYEKLKEAGNDVTIKIYDGLCHAFIISPQMKEVVRDAYPDLQAFLNKYLG